jgi:hypothetical protein
VAHTDWESGKKKDHPGNTGRLVQALRRILWRSAPSGGRIQEKPIAAATPDPLPAGRRWLQDLGCLALTLPQGEILRPPKHPRGQERTGEQQRAPPALPYRRLRLEHGPRRVTRWRIVQDRLRLWKNGVRDLVMALGCAWHNFRVRRTPWQLMI